MGREVRMVPPGWQHPTSPGRDGKPEHVPLLRGPYSRAVADWDEEAAAWARGQCRSYASDGPPWVDREEYHAGESYEECAGPRPRREDYMPEWAPGAATHYCMYECTSEGTPISPAFATPEELARWLADTGASAFADMTATYDQWLATTRRGSAVSGVIVGGQMVSGVAAQSGRDP